MFSSNLVARKINPHSLRSSNVFYNKEPLLHSKAILFRTANSLKEKTYSLEGESVHKHQDNKLPLWRRQRALIM